MTCQSTVWLKSDRVEWVLMIVDNDHIVNDQYQLHSSDRCHLKSQCSIINSSKTYQLMAYLAQRRRNQARNTQRLNQHRLKLILTSQLNKLPGEKDMCQILDEGKWPSLRINDTLTHKWLSTAKPYLVRGLNQANSQDTCIIIDKCYTNMDDHEYQ